MKNYDGPPADGSIHCALPPGYVVLRWFLQQPYNRKDNLFRDPVPNMNNYFTSSDPHHGIKSKYPGKTMM